MLPGWVNNAHAAVIWDLVSLSVVVGAPELNIPPTRLPALCGLRRVSFLDGVAIYFRLVFQKVYETGRAAYGRPRFSSMMLQDLVMVSAALFVSSVLLLGAIIVIVIYRID